MRSFLLYTFTFLTLLAGLVRADTYMNFFDDYKCKTNGGGGIDMDGQDCLDITGRHSVYIPTPFFGMERCVRLYSERGVCDIPDLEFDVYTDGYCMRLYPEALPTFKILKGRCRWQPRVEIGSPKDTKCKGSDCGVDQLAFSVPDNH